MTITPAGEDCVPRQVATRCLVTALASILLAVGLLLPAVASARSSTHSAASAAPECTNIHMKVLPQSSFRTSYHYVRHLRAAEKAVLCLTNAERTGRGEPLAVNEQGRGPLAKNAELSAAARSHARSAVAQKWWSAGRDPHTNPRTGSTPASRIGEAGYCRGGALVAEKENTYTGYGPRAATPFRAVKAWMQSDSFRANILDPGFEDLGAGVSYGNANSAPRPVARKRHSATYVLNFGRCLRPELPFPL